MFAAIVIVSLMLVLVRAGGIRAWPLEPARLESLERARCRALDDETGAEELP